MRKRFIRLAGAYALLLALIAAEVYAASAPLAGAFRYLLLAPAIVMVGVVVASMMGLGREGGPVIMFAVSGVLWLLILLGLGVLDPLTRAFYPAPESAISAALKSPLRD